MEQVKHSPVKRLALASIDPNLGVIFGVSVIAVGEAKGHGMFIDRTTLEQVKFEADKFSNGVKVKINHGSGFESIVGTLRDFRIDGEKLVADMHLLKSHERFGQIMESAKTMPDNFGLSIVFLGVNEEINGKIMARCSELYSVDLVDEPAANPTGLFKQETVDLPRETMSKAAATSAGGKFTRDSLISEILGMLKSVIGMAPAVPDEEVPEDKPEDDELKCKDKEKAMEANHQEEIKLREAKITDLSRQIELANAAIADLTKKLEEKRKLEDAELQRAANLKAQETVRNLGIPNPKVGDVPVERMSAIEQFKALTGLEKTMFYRKNKQAIFAEMRK